MLKRLLSGYTAEEVVDVQKFVTIQNVGSDKGALDTVQHSVYEVSTANTFAAGSTTRIVKKVAHGARKGDVIRCTSGTNLSIEMEVLSAPDADTLVLAGALLAAPTATVDTFNVMRYMTTKVDSSGSLITTPGPTQFVLNTVDTEVNEDTGTPANNRPLPVKLVDADGDTPAFLTPVDFLDVSPHIPSTTTIPKSSDNAISVVAVVAADIKKIQVIEDIGSFMALYSDAARTGLLCYLPLAGGEVEVSIAAGTAIYLGAVYDVDIDGAGTALMINFLG